MKILKAGTRGFYDVFVGEGWKNHTRIQMMRDKTLRFISGRPLYSSFVKQILSGLGEGK